MVRYRVHDSKNGGLKCGSEWSLRRRLAAVDDDLWIVINLKVGVAPFDDPHLSQRVCIGIDGLAVVTVYLKLVANLSDRHINAIIRLLDATVREMFNTNCQIKSV